MYGSLAKFETTMIAANTDVMAHCVEPTKSKLGDV